MAASTEAEAAGSAEPAPAAVEPLMVEASVLEALAFLRPLIGYPVLIILGLIVESPVLRREPATGLRRTAATVLAIISLVAVAPLLATVPALGAFAVLLFGGLVIPAVLTLVRLRQPPRAATPL